MAEPPAPPYQRLYTGYRYAGDLQAKTAPCDFHGRPIEPLFTNANMDVSVGECSATGNRLLNLAVPAVPYQSTFTEKGVRNQEALDRIPIVVMGGKAVKAGLGTRPIQVGPSVPLQPFWGSRSSKDLKVSDPEAAARAATEMPAMPLFEPDGRLITQFLFFVLRISLVKNNKVINILDADMIKVFHFKFLVSIPHHVYVFRKCFFGVT
jgi:hypothetical protein